MCIRDRTNKAGSAPAGSINAPVNMGAKNIWKLSSNLNSGFPYPSANDEYFSEEKPTRMKIRALPGMKNAQNPTTPDGTSKNMTFDSVSSSAYSASRWQLLNLSLIHI